MARNKFDVDERLESPFQWKHMKRAGKYIARHKGKMLAALVLSALASVASLFIPKITQWVLDDAVPNKDAAMIGKMALHRFHHDPFPYDGPCEPADHL